jgi:ammonia channel protein AmtB
MMHSFIAIIALTLQWTIFGYSFSFSGTNPFFGDNRELDGAQSQAAIGVLDDDKRRKELRNKIDAALKDSK